MLNLLTTSITPTWVVLVLIICAFALSAFARPFFSEAGKDFYHHWFAPKILRRKIKEEAPPVSIPVTVTLPSGQLGQLEPTIQERVHRITYAEIRAAFTSAPPLQRATVAKSYEGIRVQWDGRLSNATHEKDNYKLAVRIPPAYFDLVFGVVPASSYPELKSIRQDQPVRITGTIANVDSIAIELSDMELEILPTPA